MSPFLEILAIIWGKCERKLSLSQNERKQWLLLPQMHPTHHASQKLSYVEEETDIFTVDILHFQRSARCLQKLSFHNQRLKCQMHKHRG